ncbi:hypothetical protein HDU76_003732 [Blyttiomyces sp. JEL0837]|nr:hypothetical protein HDU76_003732 [Blyttiomyces sp. JEL0837]
MPSMQYQKPQLPVKIWDQVAGHLRLFCDLFELICVCKETSLLIPRTNYNQHQHLQQYRYTTDQACENKAPDRIGFHIIRGTYRTEIDNSMIGLGQQLTRPVHIRDGVFQILLNYFMDRTKFEIEGMDMLAFRAYEDVVRRWEGLPDEIFARFSKRLVSLSQRNGRSRVFQLFAKQCIGLDLGLVRMALENNGHICRKHIRQAIKSDNLITVLAFLRLFKGIVRKYESTKCKALQHEKVFLTIFDCFMEASTAISSQRVEIVELFFNLYQSLVNSLPQYNVDTVNAVGNKVPGLQDFINDTEDPLLIMAKDTTIARLLISRGAKLLSPIRRDILDKLKVYIESAATRGDIDMVNILLDVHEVVLERSIAAASMNEYQNNAKFMERTGKLVYCAKRNDYAGVVKCIGCPNSETVAITVKEKWWRRKETRLRTVEVPNVDFGFGNQAELMAACENRNLEILQILLAAGADDTDDSVVQAAARLGFDEM